MYIYKMAKKVRRKSYKKNTLHRRNTMKRRRNTMKRRRNTLRRRNTMKRRRNTLRQRNKKHRRNIMRGGLHIAALNLKVTLEDPSGGMISTYKTEEDYQSNNGLMINNGISAVVKEVSDRIAQVQVESSEPFWIEFKFLKVHWSMDTLYTLTRNTTVYRRNGTSWSELFDVTGLKCKIMRQRSGLGPAEQAQELPPGSSIQGEYCKVEFESFWIPTENKSPDLSGHQREPLTKGGVTSNQSLTIIKSPSKWGTWGNVVPIYYTETITEMMKEKGDRVKNLRVEKYDRKLTPDSHNGQITLRKVTGINPNIEHLHVDELISKDEIERIESFRSRQSNDDGESVNKVTGILTRSFTPVRLEGELWVKMENLLD